MYKRVGVGGEGGGLVVYLGRMQYMLHTQLHCSSVNLFQLYPANVLCYITHITAVVLLGFMSTLLQVKSTVAERYIYHTAL